VQESPRPAEPSAGALEATAEISVDFGAGLHAEAIMTKNKKMTFISYLHDCFSE
jgi:hypothetical protein